MECFNAGGHRGSILPPGSRYPECGRIVGSESQQRHSISVRATLLTGTAHMRLYAANFRSANFSSLNAHFRVTDYKSGEN